jgi:hypothetical protein
LTNCHPTDGYCYCPPGYRGFHCEMLCQLGTYGENCSGICNCPGSCFCDPVTGSCQVTNSTIETYWQAGQCLGELKVVISSAVVLSLQEYWLWIAGLASLATAAATSLTINVWLLWQHCVKAGKVQRIRPTHLQKSRLDRSSLMASTSSELDSDNEYYRKTFGNVPTNSTDASHQSLELIPLVS